MLDCYIVLSQSVFLLRYVTQGVSDMSCLEKIQLVSRIKSVLDSQNVEFSTAFSCTVGRERIYLGQK